MTFRKSTAVAGLALSAIMLGACAGMAPDAVKNGFPQARLHADAKPDCRDVAKGEDCIDHRYQRIDAPGTGLADYGFRDAQVSQAREARRERRRQDRRARGD